MRGETMFELLRILITGKDKDGYKYTRSQRVWILLGILAITGALTLL